MALIDWFVLSLAYILKMEMYFSMDNGVDNELHY